MDDGDEFSFFLIAFERYIAGTQDERMHLGIMLGDKTPRQTARVVFAMSTGNSRL